MTTAVAVRPGILRIAVRRYLPATLIFLGGILLWELMVIVFDIQGFLLPKPSRIASTFVDEFTVVVPAGWFTMKEAMGGFAIGAVVPDLAFHHIEVLAFVGFKDNFLITTGEFRNAIAERMTITVF